MSDQNKPTVGELADEIEAAYHAQPFDYDRMRFKLWLREKINAALAAEREKCKLWESRYYETNEALEKTQEELAADRDEYTTSIAEHSMRLNELREQLAAERATAQKERNDVDISD